MCLKMIVTLEHFSNGLGFFWMFKLENDGEMCKLWKIAKGKSKWKYRSFNTIFICWFFHILVGFLRRILRNIFHWIVGLIKESMHIRVWSWKLRMKKNAVDRYTFFFMNNESTIIIFISSGIFFWEVCFGLTVNCDLNSYHKLLSIVIFEQDFILKVYRFIQQCYLKS